MHFLCWYLILLKEKKIERGGWEHPKHSWNHEHFLWVLDAEENEPCQQQVPRLALQPTFKRTRCTLHESENDQALITLDLILNLFIVLSKNLLSCFISILLSVMISKKRWKQKISPEDCQAWNLSWTRTQGSLMVLQLIFGMTMTNLTMYLKIGGRIIVDVFKNVIMLY